MAVSPALKVAATLALAVASPLSTDAAPSEEAPTSLPPASTGDGEGEGSRAGSESAAGEGKRSGREGTRLELKAFVDAYYTSNLFHVADRHIPGFDTHLDPGQRFYGITSLSDEVIHPGARVAFAVPLGRKRDVKLGAGADHHLHLQNGIADYLKLQANGSVDVTKHDKVGVTAKLVPRRFEKNHRRPDGPVDLVNSASVPQAPFDHAYVRELELAALYDRRWSHPIATRLEFLHKRSAYEYPFHNRNEVLNEGLAALVLHADGKSKFEAGGGFGLAAAPGEVEVRRGLPMVVDRSFRQAVLFGSAHLAASEAMAFDAEVDLRNRDYTTGVAQDTTYYQRDDRRIRVKLDLVTRMGGGFSFKVFAGWTRDYSSRVDPTITPEEAGYSEIVGGVGLSWRYDSRRDR